MSISQENLFIYYLTLMVLAIAGLFALRYASGQRKISSDRLHLLLSLGCWAIIIGGIMGMVIISPSRLFGVTFSISQENLFIFYLTLTVLAIAGLFALRYASGQRKISSNRLHSLILLGCWVIIIGGIMGMVITSPSGLFSFTFSIAVIIMAILIPVGIVIIATVRPHYLSQQNALLWSMAISTEKMIPLVPTIEAFARESSGRMAEKARILAKLLASGVPLPDAVEQIPGILPARVLPMIRVGYESGALAKSLRQAVTSRDLLTVIWNSLFVKLLYIGMVIIVGTGIFTFVMIRIVPSYEKIFRDFHTSLPGITTALMGVSSFIMQTWFIFLPLYLLFIWLMGYVIFCYLGWASFNLPGFTRLMRRRHAAVILDSLALAAESNQPLGNIVLTLAGTYPQADIRRKLSYVGVDIHRGGDWCESLQRHGLIKRADLAVLKAAQRVGNLPWAMREMADSNRRRLAYRLNALVQLAYPPVIICVGLIVMFIVVALFYPLITIIQRLA
jgi:type II secretory pathway component PulF